jgi:uncharacterized protein YoxC
MSKKKIIIIASIIVALIILILAAIFIYKNNQAKNAINEKNNTVQTFTPDFLSPEEKTGFGLPTDVKVQSLKRDANNEVMVYKIIRSDSDITDPASVKAISPRAQ